MYTYEEFADKALEYVEEHGEAWLGKVKFSLQNATKINATRLGICCEKLDTDYRIAPVVYLEEIYECYQKYDDFEGVMDSLLSTMKDAYEERDSFDEEFVDKLRNLLNDHGDIMFSLIHTEQNRELLETMPHRSFLNLSIVYHWLFYEDEVGTATIPITNEIAERMGLEEEDLYQLAYQNTREKTKPTVRPMREVIKALVSDAENCEMREDADEFLKDIGLFVLTNASRERGAIGVLYPDLLQALSEQYESDLYLIPCSVHEMIVIPECFADGEEHMKNLIQEGNKHVSKYERLSNDLYKYDAKNQTIVQVTNTDQTQLLELEEEEVVGMEMV